MHAKTLPLILAVVGGVGVSGPARADGTPECNVGAGAASLECGVGSNAPADNANAMGSLADAVATGAQAVGYDADALGVQSLAVGFESRATNARTTAVGNRANASGLNATALGNATVATGIGSTSIGNGASSAGLGAIAAGSLAVAGFDNSAALGARATASAVGASALGAGATAAFDNSTALGRSATASAANQVALGGAGSHVRIGDIAASTAAQSGTIGVATVDANGVLGRDTGLFPAVAMLQGDTAHLFDITGRLRHDVRDANDGVAMALAMESPMVPAGKSMALSGGVGLFKGRAAFASAISAAVGENAQVSAGIGFGLRSKEVGARAGFQFAW